MELGKCVLYRETVFGRRLESKTGKMEMKNVKNPFVLLLHLLIYYHFKCYNHTCAEFLK